MLLLLFRSFARHELTLNTRPCNSLKFDESNKVHGQLFRCFDNTIKDLGVLIGNCVRVRSSGLPASYDAIVMMSYFSFFGIAAVVWGVGVGEYMFVCSVYIYMYRSMYVLIHLYLVMFLT